MSHDWCHDVTGNDGEDARSINNKWQMMNDDEDEIHGCCK